MRRNKMSRKTRKRNLNPDRKWELRGHRNFMRFYMWFVGGWDRSLVNGRGIGKCGLAHSPPPYAQSNWTTTKRYCLGFCTNNKRDTILNKFTFCIDGCYYHKILVKQAVRFSHHQCIKIHALVVPTTVVPPKVHHYNDPSYSWSNSEWTSNSWLFNSKYPAIVGRL